MQRETIGYDQPIPSLFPPPPAHEPRRSRTLLAVTAAVGLTLVIVGIAAVFFVAYERQADAMADVKRERSALAADNAELRRDLGTASARLAKKSSALTTANKKLATANKKLKKANRSLKAAKTDLAEAKDSASAQYSAGYSAGSGSSNETYNSGWNAGYNSGYDDGWSVGWDAGWANCHADYYC